MAELELSGVLWPSYPDSAHHVKIFHTLFSTLLWGVLVLLFLGLLTFRISDSLSISPGNRAPELEILGPEGWEYLDDFGTLLRMSRKPLTHCLPTQAS